MLSPERGVSGGLNADDLCPGVLELVSRGGAGVLDPGVFCEGVHALASRDGDMGVCEPRSRGGGKSSNGSGGARLLPLMPRPRTMGGGVAPSSSSALPRRIQSRTPMGWLLLEGRSAADGSFVVALCCCCCCCWPDDVWIDSDEDSEAPSERRKKLMPRFLPDPETGGYGFLSSTGGGGA